MSSFYVQNLNYAGVNPLRAQTQQPQADANGIQLPGDNPLLPEKAGQKGTILGRGNGSNDQNKQIKLKQLTQLMEQAHKDVDQLTQQMVQFNSQGNNQNNPFSSAIAGKNNRIADLQGMIAQTMSSGNIGGFVGTQSLGGGKGVLA